MLVQDVCSGAEELRAPHSNLQDLTLSGRIPYRTSEMQNLFLGAAQGSCDTQWAFISGHLSISSADKEESRLGES
ncbi:hypothetical protein SCP_0900670 [Sparassis crispa]|uniref:Uncharacterized protein n=1 Tax=Sparassis crispa TaxID=139825 RepID=A0A401GVH7_9APHY|nr:hypothetical protein SCP_0900670 [Sparassis crispa]GBE86189.1 hypothetical protein SCP_0900670 [Sparassis crispa]